MPMLIHALVLVVLFDVEASELFGVKFGEAPRSGYFENHFFELLVVDTLVHLF